MQKLFTIAVILFGITSAGVFQIANAETEGEIVTIEFFSDLDADSIVGQAAANLRQEGIIGGYPDGTFKADKLVNRAELSKFLLLARQVDVGNKRNNGRFPDVLEGQWYVRYIIAAADLGVLSGYPGGNFKPGQAVNTAEFLKMLVKNFYVEENMDHDYSDVSEDDWFEPYAGAAIEYELFPSRDGSRLEPGRQMTRGEVAVAIYKMMVPKEEQGDIAPDEEVYVSESGVNAVSASIEVTTANELAQMAMVSPGKESELILPLNLKSTVDAKIKNVRITLSQSGFLDEIWVKDGERISANRRVSLTIPVNKTMKANQAVALELFASIKKGLSQGDLVKIKLEKVEWEYKGMAKIQAFPRDGYELMVY